MLIFDEPWYQDINHARWTVARGIIEQLYSNGARSCLDVGCGPGWFSEKMVAMGLAVHGVDGRPHVVETARCRVKAASFSVANVEDHAGVLSLQPADLVFCFGLLYHLENPFAAIRNMFRLTQQVLLIETRLIPREEPLCWLVDERLNEAQGLHHNALMLTLAALLKMLFRAGFLSVYEYVGKISHEEFYETPDLPRRRRIVMASKEPKLDIAGFFARGGARNSQI